VQTFACRLASHQWDSSYLDLLQLYQLPPLEERRMHLKLGLMFKILHSLCYYPDVPSFRDNIHRRAIHAFQFKLPFAHTNAYYFPIFLTQYQYGILWIANVLPLVCTIHSRIILEVK